jgi:hypothetical protein
MAVPEAGRGVSCLENAVLEGSQIDTGTGGSSMKDILDTLEERRAGAEL